MLRGSDGVRAGMAMVLLVAGWAARGAAPVGSVENPRQITSSDMGPDIDPVKLAARPYNALPVFTTFRSFMSLSYALPGVWVYAENDEQALYDTRIHYPYPEFYTPTWGEVFDDIARQMRCSWEWNPKNRQFRFARTAAKPFFGVTLADGWRSEDRGEYVWHAPRDLPFGMDIYYFGHYTVAAGEKELPGRIRAHVAMAMLKQWPKPPGVDAMKKAKVGDAQALYLECPTPRPGATWRQWSFMAGGHAFLIVSVMPNERAAAMRADVDGMVKTFTVKGEKGKSE